MPTNVKDLEGSRTQERYSKGLGIGKGAYLRIQFNTTSDPDAIERAARNFAQKRKSRFSSRFKDVRIEGIEGDEDYISDFKGAGLRTVSMIVIDKKGQEDYPFGLSSKRLEDGSSKVYVEYSDLTGMPTHKASMAVRKEVLGLFK